MTTEEPRPRGRPRRTETDEQIVRAAQELIREHGPTGVSVAGVSSRSGLARTTIYRRYRDRQALLTAALQPVADSGRPPEGLTVEEKIGWVLSRTEDVLTHGLGPGGVGSVLADADAEFSSALRHSLAEGLRPVLQQIEDDVSHGALTPDADPEVLLNLILGSYLAETLRHGTPTLAWRRRTAKMLSALLAG